LKRKRKVKPREASPKWREAFSKPGKRNASKFLPRIQHFQSFIADSKQKTIFAPWLAFHLRIYATRQDERQ
jgi:hypothetical protein